MHVKYFIETNIYDKFDEDHYETLTSRGLNNCRSIQQTKSASLTNPNTVIVYLINVQVNMVIWAFIVHL